jgi:hypothetical protein
MLKLLFIISMLSSGFVFSEEVCFRGLYQVDLAKLMGKRAAYGQCIDLKKHFLNSLPFVKKNGIALKESINECKSVKEARDFCAKNEDVSLCYSLDDYLGVLDERVMKNAKLSPHSIKRRIVKSVSREEFGIPFVFLRGLKYIDNQNENTGHCLSDKEFSIAVKYSEAVLEKFKGDNGIGKKVLDKLDNALDDDGANPDLSFFKEVKDDCNAEISEIRVQLYNRYTDLVKKHCLPELAKKGFSFYDKKAVYCGGETPLACTLYKRAPTSKK